MSNVSECLDKAGYDRLLDKMLKENDCRKRHMSAIVVAIRHELDAIESGVLVGSQTSYDADRLQDLSNDLIDTTRMLNQAVSVIKELRFLHSAVGDVEISTDEILDRR